MKRSSMVLFTALLVAAVILSAVGCGSKNKSAESARKILEKSQKAVLKAKSLKINGSSVLKTPGAEEKISKETFTGEFNIISPSEVEAHLVTQDQDGQQSEAYLVGDYAYAYSPNSGWEKQKTSGAMDLALGVVDPSNISAMTKYAENLEKLPDQDNNYVISFEVGKDFFNEMLAGVDEASSAPATAEQSLAQQYSELFKTMVGDVVVSVVMQIDKTSFYPSEATIKASAKDVPIMGDVTSNSEMAFTDFNVPVTVTLPPEAAGAKEVETGLPSGLPGLPGLGI